MARITRIEGAEEWLTPAEVARLYRVDPKTVTRWAQSGVIPEQHIIRTLGLKGKGHRRYRRSWLEQQLSGGGK
jgi:hypothetical protein